MRFLPDEHLSRARSSKGGLRDHLLFGLTQVNRIRSLLRIRRQRPSRNSLVRRRERVSGPALNKLPGSVAAISSATRVCRSSLHLESELLARLGGGGEGVSFGGRSFKPWQTSVAFAQLHFTFTRVCQLWWLEREILGIQSIRPIIFEKMA